jgi:hypothetical protein
MFNLFTKIKNLFVKEETKEMEDYHILSDEEYIQFHNERLAELAPWIVEKAVKSLSELQPLLLEETRELYKEDPVHWMSPYHFSTGMAVRNFLRGNVCLDDELTTKIEYQNWDNFYVALLEIAAGVREYPNQVRVVKG